jgi:nicotinamide mononucleotide transporter
MVTNWIADNIAEIFGAVAGIAYVILEIKRNILLWPLGIITSAVYIYVFGRNGLYANMGLQVYYLVISVYGWYAWRRAQGSWLRARGSELRAHKEQSDAVRQNREIEERTWSKTTQSRKAGEPGAQGSEAGTDVVRISRRTALFCFITALILWGLLWFVLDRWTDSPVPLWDGLITSMSVVATWMLTRKYLEQWYVWIVANVIAVIVYLVMGMYPTAVLFMVYFAMAIIGVREWRRQSPVLNRQPAVKIDRMTAGPSKASDL